MSLLSRRQSLQQLAFGLSCFGTWVVQAAPAHVSVTLPTTDSLRASLAQALARQQPLVVMVSLPNCPYCKVVRENYLNPLRPSGLEVVQVDMRDARQLLGFDGAALTQDAWVRQQGVSAAPTVLFFGPQGKEVATRLVGAYLADFYGAYLDTQLALARKAVGTP